MAAIRVFRMNEYLLIKSNIYRNSIFISFTKFTYVIFILNRIYKYKFVGLLL